MNVFTAWLASLLLFATLMLPVGAVVGWLLWRRYVTPAERRLASITDRED